MKKIQQTIMKDIGWKLLSVCIAIGLWFMVINIENPIDTRSYSQTIKFENEDILEQQGLIVTNMDDFVSAKVIIKVKAERSSLDRLSQYRNYIQATVDLKKATASVGNGELIPLNVEVKLPATAGDNFEIVSKDPLSISVKIETIVTVEKTVTAEITGDASQGYVMASPVVSPGTVKISGPESAVNEVTSVKAKVAVTSANKDTTVKAPLAAYDKNGILVDHITILPQEADVTVPVSKSKSVLVKVTAQGLPQEGFTVEKIDWSPKFIEVVGSESALNALSEITLPVVRIQNAFETIVEQYDAAYYLPDNVYVKNGTTDTVTVTVAIKPQTEKTITVPGSRIILEGSLPETMKATFRPQDIEITIKGPEEQMNAIDTTQISGKIHIADLTTGSHIVPIEFALPEGVTILGEPPVTEIMITDETQTPLPLEPPNETPTEPEEQTGIEDDTQNIPEDTQNNMQNNTQQ